MDGRRISLIDQKTNRIKIFDWVVKRWLRASYGLFLILAAIGCNLFSPVADITNIPIEVTSSDTSNIRGEIVIENATIQVQNVLPEAQLVGVVFSGKCEDLPQLRGKVVLDFVATQFSFPRERIVSAIASVDTIEQMMDIHVRDMTNVSWSTEVFYSEEGLSLNEILIQTANQIEGSGLSNCDITLTSSKEVWVVRCGALENFVQECYFEVDSDTGEIILQESLGGEP